MMMRARIEGRLGGPRLRSPEEAVALLARHGVVLRERTPDEQWRSVVSGIGGRQRVLESAKVLDRTRRAHQWRSATAGLVDQADEVDAALARLRSAA